MAPPAGNRCGPWLKDGFAPELLHTRPSWRVPLPALFDSNAVLFLLHGRFSFGSFFLDAASRVLSPWGVCGLIPAAQSPVGLLTRLSPWVDFGVFINSWGSRVPFPVREAAGSRRPRYPQGAGLPAPRAFIQGLHWTCWPWLGVMEQRGQ